ncbi:MAG: hypothetical protein BJ554DRAFT_4583, partial [Olpidium bornovanus]
HGLRVCARGVPSARLRTKTSPDIHSPPQPVWWVIAAMRLADLALAATQASAEVALVCVAGALLARHGVFTQQVQRAMVGTKEFCSTSLNERNRSLN